jgi:malto-oligosyltrehalose trehalohydrolase
MKHSRNLEFGARIESDCPSDCPTDCPKTQFRVWAPKAKRVKLQLVRRSDGGHETVLDWHRMQHDGDGAFCVTATAPAGTLYRFKIDDHPGHPDPRSMFQPFGVHGPSQVVDHHAYPWKDKSWKGIAKRDLVIYELHLGSFTAQGTYLAAIERLDSLVDLGITAIEVLPLAQSPGRWNWGYDGVNFFAPRNTFGTPDQLKAFVDACHNRGIAVIIDVVYNHVGPEGNYLSSFGPYASSKHGTPWGDALNFDGKQSEHVRQFVIDNVLFWIDEYHFDGLRLDAVHYMFDDSPTPILESIRSEFRQHQSSLKRKTYLIGEANIYDPDLAGSPHDRDQHWDAIWSDCVMHSIIKIGEPNLKLTDRKYTPLDLAEAIEHGYVFTAPGAIRMTPEQRQLHHPTGDKSYIESLVMALQTHDSVGNHPHGSRLHHLTDIDFQMAAAPLILLYPSIPMIFMGEESALDSPFPFFADFEDERLRKAVDRGRQHEYPHHDWHGSPVPSAPEAFHNSVFNADNENARVNTGYRELLRLRKQGIAGGWLHIENLSCYHDLENQIYQLQYQHGTQTIGVCCRLARLDAAPVASSIDESHRIVFNSLSQTDAHLNRDDDIDKKSSDEKSTGGYDFLSPRQCLVWIKDR